jgi:hypothetical protein
MKVIHNEELCNSYILSNEIKDWTRHVGSLKRQNQNIGIEFQ